MSTTLEDRFILLLREDGEPYGYWQGLEGRTGIAAARWRKAYTRQQRPTTDMVSAIAKLKPQYAFWLVTGVTDAENGHTAPVTAMTFPEMPKHKLSDQLAEDYFKESISLNEYLYYAANVDTADDTARLEATERQRLGAQWWGGSLVDTAYELAAQDAYMQLMALRDQREERRKKKLDPPKRAGKGVAVDPMPVGDPRTAHQGENDLFWKSPADTTSQPER